MKRCYALLQSNNKTVNYKGSIDFWSNYYNLLMNIRVLNKRTTLGKIYLENKYIRTIRVKKVNVTSFIK